MTAPIKSAVSRFVRLLPAIPALPPCAQAAESQLFKCKDAAERSTYSSSECGEFGLGSAGEIKDRTSVSPAMKAAAPAENYAGLRC